MNRPSSIRSDEGIHSGEVTPTTTTPKLSPLLSPSELPHPFYDYKEERAHLNVSTLAKIDSMLSQLNNRLGI